ncbi:hypothetical protein B296_00000880 [Ensete ventricosum]|uniref:Uncharacterized protein n=1 Tax=Ensete ventricosum TaxID=4639 RepID=A0A426ZGK9_ENSVE|nr:hypothetical protein B296_00000880 [Ensete ventricosum]
MSRVLSRPSRDFVSVVVVPSTSALGDSRTADALVAMCRVLLGRTQQILRERCTFQQQRLDVEFFLHFLSPRLELPGRVDLSDARDARVSMVEKSPSSSTEAGLRKRLRKAAIEQPTDASGSTARTSVDKDKRTVELGMVPERGYTMRELCEVEDQVGADRYLTSIMMQLKCVEGEDPLVPRWSTDRTPPGLSPNLPRSSR